MADRSERVTFTNASGERLAARLDWPASALRAFALFAHCFTCSKGLFAAARVSQALAGLGLAVLRFDVTGLGSPTPASRQTSPTSFAPPSFSARSTRRRRS